jgi:polysaccharide deacetylase family protein (PEP-CTERM system associated)
MKNALSVDVEDYFHVEAFTGNISRDDWDHYSSRVGRNVDAILDLFSKYDTKGTFFILGWVAERFPHLIRNIAGEGHEVGCHGFDHQHIARQTPGQFRMDVQKARECLINLSGQAVQAYRAPSFSIVQETLWALDILVEEGFTIDSSIFPARHDLYGIETAPRSPHWAETPAGKSIFEFPPSTLHLWTNNLGVAGGGYLRFAPYCLTHKAIRYLNESERRPAMVYFHPWELDPEQPRIAAKFRSRLRHYTNLSTMKKKVERLLQDFQFATITSVCSELDVYRTKAQAALATGEGIVSEVL